MKDIFCGLIILTVSMGATLGVRAAEAPDPAPPAERLTKEQLREQVKPLTPEQRQAKIKEMREKLGGPGSAEFEKRRSEFEKLRQEMQSLPPGERATRLQAWRQTNGFTNTLARPVAPGLSPEDSTAKRNQFRERIDSELTRLKAKKADGSITPEETRRLERMSEWSKRLESVPTGPAGPGLQKRPSIDEQFPKPVEPAPSKPAAPAPAPSK